MDRVLDGWVKRMKAAAGDNLQSLVLYGSAASGEFRARHSDLNTLCLLHRVGVSDLARLHRPAHWLVRKGHPMPLVLALQDLREAADIYAIELLEIKAHRQILYGEDVFGDLEVPMGLHRTQVERELRHQLIRLRQGYVAAAGSRRRTLALIVRSASVFGLLFRHALIALGEPAAGSKRDAVWQLAGRLGFDASSFDPLFELRDGARKRPDPGRTGIFENYLNAVSAAVTAVSRKFDEMDRPEVNL